MSIEENKQIVHHIIEEGLSKHELELIDKYFDPEFIENQFGHQCAISRMKENFQFLYGAPQWKILRDHGHGYPPLEG